MITLKPEKSTFADPVTGHAIHRFTTQGCNTHPYASCKAWTCDGEWFFFLRVEAAGAWLAACHYDSGEIRKLAGPFPAGSPGDWPSWAQINAIPGTRDVAFVQAQAVWRVGLDGALEKVAAIGLGGKADVSADGRWFTAYVRHVPDKVKGLSLCREQDGILRQHGVASELVRVDLRSGVIERLWREPGIIDHINVNPKDPDLILFCHCGTEQRMWLYRVGDAESRPLRDHRSGLVGACHERWMPDGERIVYHGDYRRLSLFDGKESLSRRPRNFFVGIFDVARDLPHEYLVSRPYTMRQPWHCSPSPDGRRLVTDARSGGGEILLQSGMEERGIDFIRLDEERGECSFDLLCSLHSDAWQPQQWCEMDPVWSPDGSKILFSVARDGTTHVYVIEAPPEREAAGPADRLHQDLSKWMAQFPPRDRLVEEFRSLPDANRALIRVPIVQAAYAELKTLRERAQRLVEDLDRDTAAVAALRAALKEIEAAGTLSDEYARQVDRLLETRTDIPVIVRDFEASDLLPSIADIRSAAFPGADIVFRRMEMPAFCEVCDVRTLHGGKGGTVYIRGRVNLPCGGAGQLLYGADGPVRVWVNGVEAGCEPAAANPALVGEYSAPAAWRAGENEIVYCLNTNEGKAWGVCGRAVCFR